VAFDFEGAGRAGKDVRRKPERRNTGPSLTGGRTRTRDRVSESSRVPTTGIDHRSDSYPRHVYTRALYNDNYYFRIKFSSGGIARVGGGDGSSFGSRETRTPFPSAYSVRSPLRRRLVAGPGVQPARPVFRLPDRPGYVVPFSTLHRLTDSLFCHSRSRSRIVSLQHTHTHTRVYRFTFPITGDWFGRRSDGTAAIGPCRLFGKVPFVLLERAGYVFRNRLDFPVAIPNNCVSRRVDDRTTNSITFDRAKE